MYYELYELNHALMSPARAGADVLRLYFRNPLNPFAHTLYGRSVVAATEVFESVTRRYGKPEWGIESVEMGDRTSRVQERIVWQRPFCNLVHFDKLDAPRRGPSQPNVLLVAPLSGHYATLLRGTVQAFLPDHQVYVTDWVDARMVPVEQGPFDLDSYIDYLKDMLASFGGDVHVVAVCQPAVPVFAAVALLEAERSVNAPRSMTLIGGPIDTRRSPTAVNELAMRHDLEWFRRNVIHSVPFPHPGFMRKVYPGFLQLSGFMSMNLDRHVSAYREFFDHLAKGDGDSADKHREFYNEYLSVMDLTAEFYLQTVDTVFIEQALPNGQMMHRDQPVEPAAIRHTALMTVEGEFDDISGLGQTRAAHDLAAHLSPDRRAHYEQKGVGHYGVFNGSRFRAQVQPKIAEFIAKFEREPVGVDGHAATNVHVLHGAPGAARPQAAPTEPASVEAVADESLATSAAALETAAGAREALPETNPPVTDAVTALAHEPLPDPETAAERRIVAAVSTAVVTHADGGPARADPAPRSDETDTTADGTPVRASSGNGATHPVHADVATSVAALETAHGERESLPEDDPHVLEAVEALAHETLPDPEDSAARQLVADVSTKLVTGRDGNEAAPGATAVIEGATSARALRPRVPAPKKAAPHGSGAQPKGPARPGRQPGPKGGGQRG